MENEPSDSVPPELQALMDTEIEVKAMSAVQEQELESALVSVPGVASFSSSECKLTIRYDPEQVSAAHLRALITQQGFEIIGAESAPSSPPIDPVRE